METNSIRNFFNCVHPSGYKIIHRDGINYLVAKNPKEKLSSVKVALEELYVEIETNKRNFRSSSNKDEIILSFANRYGLLTAVLDFKIFDYVYGDLPYLRYMDQNISSDIRFNDEMLSVKAKKEEAMGLKLKQQG